MPSVSMNAGSAARTRSPRARRLRAKAAAPLALRKEVPKRVMRGQ